MVEDEESPQDEFCPCAINKLTADGRRLTQIISVFDPCKSVAKIFSWR